MHEYSLATELVNTLTERVENKILRKTTIVHVKLGELRLLSVEAFQKAYQMVVENTPLSGSNIEFEDIEAEVSCPECGFEGQAEYEHDPAYHYSTPILSCPECGSAVNLDKGREFEVDTLTIVDETEQPADDETNSD